MMARPDTCESTVFMGTATGSEAHVQYSPLLLLLPDPYGTVTVYRLIHRCTKYVLPSNPVLTSTKSLNIVHFSIAAAE
jgi:hypothetical protein